MKGRKDKTVLQKIKVKDAKNAANKFLAETL